MAKPTKSVEYVIKSLTSEKKVYETYDGYDSEEDARLDMDGGLTFNSTEVEFVLFKRETSETRIASARPIKSPTIKWGK